MMKEDLIRSLMADSRLAMPYNDFEERVMARIAREQRIKASSVKYKNIALLFFAAGTLFGAVMLQLLAALPLLSQANDLLLVLSKLGYTIPFLIALNYVTSHRKTLSIK